MKYRLYFYSFLFVFLLGNISKAQQLLTLEEAVRIALENNYDIKLSSNQVEVNKNNKNLANAGLLPTLGGNFSTNKTIQDLKQVQSNGTETIRNNAHNSNLNYSVNLNWTIFKGFQLRTRYSQLKELSKQSEADLQSAILNTVSEVIRSYYDLVQQQQQITANDTALSLSRFRLSIATTRYKIGKSAKLEVLNALVDLNTDTTNYLKQLNLYKNAKTSLNELLARDINTSFHVVDTISINKNLTLDTLLNIVKQQNPSLRSTLIAKRIAELNLKQVKAQRYPTIGLNSAYSFSDSRSALGFATQSTGKGFNYGFTASVNIFNGFLQNRNEQNAKILISTANIQYDKLLLNIHTQLTMTYQNYLTNLALVKLEESNVTIAKQNMDITLDKFKYGNITPLEFREAQRNYIDATVRFSNAQLQAKLAEISLKELTGNFNL